MQVVVGNYSLSEVNYVPGTREIIISKWNHKFNYDNIISVVVNRGGDGNNSFIIGDSGKWFGKINQIDSTTYKIRYMNALPELKINDGVQIIVDIKYPLDVYVTDQNSQIISIYALKKLNNTILSSETIVNSNIIYFENGHNCKYGDYLNFYGENKINQSKVIGVTGNTIALNAPMDVIFTSGDTIERGTINLGINGTTGSTIFIAKPSPNIDWHICQIVIYIEDDDTMDGSLFGSISALTKGVLIRKKNTTYDNILEITRNSQMNMYGELKYNDRASSKGVYSLICKLKLNDKSTFGSVIELLSERNDQIEIIIQDDLSALKSFYISIHGHVVQY